MATYLQFFSIVPYFACFDVVFSRILEAEVEIPFDGL